MYDNFNRSEKADRGELCLNTAIKLCIRKSANIVRTKPNHFYSVSRDIWRCSLYFIISELWCHQPTVSGGIPVQETALQCYTQSSGSGVGTERKAEPSAQIAPRDSFINVETIEEECGIPGYNETCNGNYLPTFRDNLSYHQQGSIIKLPPQAA
jgi:hypothetical protein